MSLEAQWWYLNYDFLYCIIKCHHLKHLHNSELKLSKLSAHDVTETFRAKHNRDQWILMGVSMKSLLIYFQIPCCNKPRGDCLLASFGAVSKKKKKQPQLSEKAFKILFFLPAAYLCEAGLSLCTLTKATYYKD